MHSGMSYTFIRNTNRNGTIVGRIANQKNRQVTKYILQYRVNEITVQYCFLIYKLNRHIVINCNFIKYYNPCENACLINNIHNQSE